MNAKKALGKCVICLLLAYLVVIVIAYGCWYQRRERYEVPIRAVERRRERLFYIESDNYYNINALTCKMELLKRLESEKASGSNITVTEGLLIEDTRTTFKPILDILSFAFHHGVTKATFESGPRPPHYQTLTVSLVTRANTPVIVVGQKGVVVEISETSTTVGETTFPGDDLWHLDDTADDIKEFLKSRDYNVVVLRIHDSFNVWCFSPIVDILNDLGAEVSLEVPE